MFSSTTIELSTIMPTPNARPPSDIRLSENTNAPAATMPATAMRLPRFHDSVTNKMM
jgi:hypothetical protein